MSKPQLLSVTYGEAHARLTCYGSHAYLTCYARGTEDTALAVYKDSDEVIWFEGAFCFVLEGDVRDAILALVDARAGDVAYRMAAEHVQAPLLPYTICPEGDARDAVAVDIGCDEVHSNSKATSAMRKSQPTRCTEDIMTEKKARRGWLEDLCGNEEFQQLVKQEEFVESFLSQIEEVMTRRAMSRSDLARAMKYRPARVARIMKRTKKLTVETMIHMATVLGCELKLSVVQK